MRTLRRLTEDVSIDWIAARLGVSDVPEVALVISHGDHLGAKSEAPDGQTSGASGIDRHSMMGMLIHRIFCGVNFFLQ